MNKYIQYLFGGLLLAVITFIFFGNLIWINLNQVSPFYDTAGHTNLAHIYANIYRGEFPAYGFTGFMKISTYYPPLMYWLGGVVALVFGFYYKNLQYFTLLFLPISALFLYLYSLKLTKERLVAVVATTLFVLYPHIWEQSRYYMLDLPLTTFVLISLYFLARSDQLQKRYATLGFFIFGGLAQLVKWYAWLYLLVPVVFILVSRFKHRQLNLKWITTFIASGVVTALWVFPWFIINFHDLVAQSVLFSRPDYGDPEVLLSLRNLLSYIVLLLNYQVVSVLFLWLVVSFYLIYKSRKISWMKMILAYILVIYIVFTFVIGNKNLRYIMPLLPMLAIVMAYGWHLVWRQNKKIAGVVYAVLVLFGLLFFTLTSFGNKPITDWSISASMLNGVDRFYLVDLTSKYIPYRYEKTNWQPQVLIDDLWQLSEGGGARVLVVSNNPYVSQAGLWVYSIRDKYTLVFDSPPHDQLKSYTSKEEIQSYVDYYHFIVVPENNVAPIGQINFNNLHAIRSYVLGGSTRDFVLMKTYTLPDGESLYLLRNDKQVNTLDISISSQTLTIQRRPAVAKVFMQFQDKNGEWFQSQIENSATEFSLQLENIQTIRIDYPAELIRPQLSPEWTWDGDKQFNRIVTQEIPE